MTLTSGQILDVSGVGVRTDGFVFELLDGSRNSIGLLDVDLDSPPQVRFDTTRATQRTCTTLAISAADLSAIDTRRDRVRVWMTLQNGEWWPLGVFAFGDDNRAEQSWGTTWTPALFDEQFILDQPLTAPPAPLTSWSLPPGVPILGFVNAVVASAGLVDVDLSMVVDGLTSAAVSWKTGVDTTRKMLADLIGILGYYPPFFNNAGTYTTKAVPAVGATADHAYGPGGRVIPGSRHYANSSYRAPNYWQVTSSVSASAVVGHYELPASAPNSTANGYPLVVVSREQTGIPTSALADLAAHIWALTDRNSFTKATFASIADPRHDGYDLVDLYGQTYQEVAWSITCRSGEQMSHDLVGFYGT